MSVFGHQRRPAGLTLLEMLVVITLMGLVAATVTVQITGRIGHAAMGQAITQWEFTDSQLRQRARRKGQPVAMYLEVGTEQVECAFNPDDDSARTVRSLGRGVRLARFMSATREVTNGPITIEYSEQGTTETFAIELESHHERHWLLVAGITGQITELADAREIEQLFDQLLPTGIHVD